MRLSVGPSMMWAIGRHTGRHTRAHRSFTHGHQRARIPRVPLSCVFRVPPPHCAYPVVLERTTPHSTRTLQRHISTSTHHRSHQHAHLPHFVPTCQPPSPQCGPSPWPDSPHQRHFTSRTNGDMEDSGVMSDSEFDSDLFQRVKMMDKDQLDLLRVSLYPESSDPVTQAISEANSVQEVFDLVEGNAPSVEHLCQSVVTLWDLQKVYGRYGYDCSMITKHQISQFLNKILIHPSFEMILAHLSGKSEELDNNSLSCMLLYLNKIGLRTSAPIMQRLTVTCIERLDGFDMNALSRLTVYLRDQGIRAYFIQSKLLPMIACRVQSCSDVDEFYLLTISINSSKRLVINSLIDTYIALVERKINEGFFDTCDPRITLKVIRLLTYPEWSSKRKFIRRLMLCLSENFQALSVSQVMDLSNYFQSYLEPKEIYHKIRQYCANEIVEEKAPGERPDLLCLAPFTSRSLKNYFEALIAEQLQQKDLFEYIMVLFKALRYIKSSNVKLCNAFWMKAMRAVEEEVSRSEDFVGMKELVRRKVYQRYMYFNNNMGGTYRNYTLERNMSSLLLEDLSTTSRLLPSKVANIAAFLISYSSRQGIPEAVYERVLLCGSQFSNFDVVTLSRGVQISLALNRRNLQRTLTQQITAICRMLDSRTEELLKSASSLMDIINLTRGYLSRHGSPRSFIFDRIMAAHLPVLNELNARHIKDICFSFCNTLYLAPQILEAMVDYVVENQEFLLGDTMEEVVTCLYTLGYTPQNINQLMAACTTSFLQESQHLRGLNVLQMCLAMNMYGHLTSQVIQTVFNIKFMDQLDEEIDRCYSKATYPSRVRHLLMELNRAVCLDHPEENIPWFHEKYCEDFLETVAVSTNVFHSEVHQALVQLVGGPEVLRANVHTPYYYLLDFEFVLDGSNNAVPVKDYISPADKTRTRKNFAEEIKPGQWRVCVLLRKEKHYCTNSRELLGRHQVERRHLELLGYTVLEVPHFLWCSMAMATQEDRVHYLSNLIFPDR